MALPVLPELRLPGRVQLAPPPAEPGRQTLPSSVGHQELGVLRPAVEPLGEPDLLLAQRLTVGGAGVLLGRRAEGDVAVDDDEGRAVVGVLEHPEGATEHVEVVRVAHPGHVPAVADEAGGRVVGERPVGAALDRDPVVVVDPAQVGELEVAGERGRLARHPLHHVAVAAEGVDVVVEQLEVGTVEVGRLPPAGDRHPDAGRHPLTQRAGGGLDARSEPVFRVAWTLAVELAEALDVLEGDGQLALPLVLGVDRFHAGEVEHGIQQHRGVSVRQHEPVAVGPDRILGIKTEEILPQGVDHGRQRHRGTGVAGVGRLDRIMARVRIVLMTSRSGSCAGVGMSPSFRRLGQGCGARRAADNAPRRPNEL